MQYLASQHMPLETSALLLWHQL